MYYGFSKSVLVVSVCAAVANVNALTMETVPVENAGNTGEATGVSVGGVGPDRISGAVGYNFRMGKYEVTAGQYAEFLNAVAASDTYNLWNSEMGFAFGCRITRSGTDGSYVYSVTSTYADGPVNYVSWGDAARFCNWLHNGRPTGAQGLSTTEDGSYYLNGAVSEADLSSVVREDDATWVIPTEDEWYKAAYHKNDGVTGNYFDYPTSSDTTPSNVLTNPDPGNNACFYDSGYTLTAKPYTTEAGAFANSASPYGTFDQGGNVREWTEEIPSGGNRRMLRGGAFHVDAADMAAAYRYNVTPTAEQYPAGFRVANVFNVEMVPVGNAGNTGEATGVSVGGVGPDRISGAVSYSYEIGAFEITAGQYTAFLNAVAATDTYNLYNTYMPDNFGCRIVRSGTSGNYTYSVADEYAYRPVNYISWSDAARLCNWLHNGQPIGAQDLSTTEDGSYYLNGATSEVDLTSITRELDATWVIPSEDEWYKAAYHKNDGVTGNYYDYPTASDTTPSNVLADPDPGNNACFYDSGYTLAAKPYTTEAGAFVNSYSAYGTFDQGGNVREWTEEIPSGGYRRMLRGGSFHVGSADMSAAVRYNVSPIAEQYPVGVRLGYLP